MAWIMKAQKPPSWRENERVMSVLAWPCASIAADERCIHV